jgi:fucose 4-O-acetylase-like acetyltransferase
MRERINWIDVARGIGVLLVIYGHGLAATPLRYIIYSFHMPLFFFLSGLIFHKRKNEKYLVILKKDLKRILIPYFIFAFISFFLWLSNIPFDRINPDLVLKQIIGIFYGSGNSGYLAINIVLWFLPCLFIVKQAFWFLSKLPNKFILISLIILSITGYLNSIFYPSIKLPFGFETALTGIVFFGFGYLWNFIPKGKLEILKKYAFKIFFIFTVSTIIFALINFNLHGHQVDLRINKLNNFFLFYLSSISGILAVVSISSQINKNKILEYLGKNSLILFVWHLVIFSYISDFVFIFLTSEQVIKLRNVYLAPFYSIVSIIIIISISRLFKLRLRLKQN